MDDAGYLAAIERDGAGLLEATAAADPAATVPSCPEWHPIDLVWHVGVVHAFWGAVVAGRLSGPPDPWPPERPVTADGVVEFGHRATAELLATLAAADPADAIWTWAGRRDIRWVFRRMAHETAVHRVDADQVAGRPGAVEPELAADGIDEFLTLFLQYPTDDAPPLGGSLHLHCTDAVGEWTITPGDEDALVVTHEHTKADAALRGPASDLLLALWRRVEIADTETQVFGDEALATRFLARTNND